MTTKWQFVRARYLVGLCMLTFVGIVVGFVTYLSFPDTGLEASYDRVGRVDPGGPAERAGIRPGDQIIAINGKPFLSRGDAFISPGDHSAIYTLARDGQQLQVTLSLSEFSVQVFFQKFGHYFMGFGLWLIGAWILFLRARDTRADLLILCCLLAALFIAVLPFADLGLDWPNRLAIVLLMLVSPIFVQYHCIFPEYKPLAGKRRPILAALYFTGGALCLARVPFPTLMLAESGWLLPLNVLMRVFLLFCMLLGLALLAHTYRSTASLLIRQQASLMLLGTGVSVLLVSLLVVVPQIVSGTYLVPTYPVFLLLLLIPFSYAYATYRHRLMSIDRKVNRTVMAVTLAIVLLGVYGAIEEIVSRFVLQVMPGLDSRTASWIAMAVVVSSIIPLKERTQRLVDTAFYGGWYSYRSIIQKLAAHLSHVKDFETLTSQLVNGLAGDLRIQSVALVLPDGDHQLRVWESVGFPDNNCNMPIQSGSALVKYLVEHGGPVKHAQLETSLSHGGMPLPQEIRAWRDARLWVPLLRDDELEGILILGVKEVEDFFDDEDLIILKTLAQQAAISIQNLRLIKTLRQHLGELERLYRELMRAREEEQRRLARDLHDTVIQELAALSHRLEQHAGEVGKHALLIESAQDSAQHILADLRAMCSDIQHAVVVNEIGLAAALQRQVDHLTDESALQIDVQMSSEVEIQRIPIDAQACLYRVCQELLQNVRKHSLAQKVQVTLCVSEEQARLKVRDDGKGFVVPNSITQLVDNNHFGLAGMEQRVTAFGGKINIQSAISKGTIVEVCLPIILPYAITVDR